MENISYTETQKATTSLGPFQTFCSLNPGRSELLNRVEEINQSNSGPPRLNIKFENGHIDLYQEQKLILTVSESTGLKFFLNFLTKFNKQEEQIDHFNKVSHSLENVYAKTNNSNARLINRIERFDIRKGEHLLAHLDRTIWPKRKSELKQIIKNLSSIKILPRLLLESNLFEGHTSAQILIHKRGTSSVQSYFYSSLHGLKTNQVSNKEFNHFFNHVKKSKNKVFDKENINVKDLSVIGKLLAKEFELASHNILLVISRESFLAPTKYEIDYFEYITSLLSPYFDSLLNKEAELLKNFFILQCLHSVPIPIAIFDAHKNCIFHNYERAKSGHLISKTTFNLPRGKYLEVYSKKSEKITSDIFHFKRISLLGELLNTLRHELSNPIFGIKLTSDLLIDEIEDEDLKDSLNDISLSINRCQNIIENFSNLYQQHDTFQEINLKQIIDETMTLAKSEIKFIQKEVDIKVDEKELLITSNPTWIYQIIFNLIINSSHALKKTGLKDNEKKITLSVQSDDKCLFINIRDNGPGIGDDDADRIFRPFFTTKEKGTGLGLAICKNLSEKLGGSMAFHNNFSGPGATFTLSIPK